MMETGLSRVEVFGISLRPPCKDRLRHRRIRNRYGSMKYGAERGRKYSGWGGVEFRLPTLWLRGAFNFHRSLTPKLSRRDVRSGRLERFVRQLLSLSFFTTNYSNSTPRNYYSY